MSDELVHNVVPNLTVGLANLRYEYFIYRLGEPQSISQEERSAAITELRHMGIEVIDTPKDRMQIKKTPLPYLQRIARLRSKATPAKWLPLLERTRGAREVIEISARSDFPSQQVHSRETHYKRRPFEVGFDCSYQRADGITLAGGPASDLEFWVPRP
jgi:hypothetical protein